MQIMILFDHCCYDNVGISFDLSDCADTQTRESQLKRQTVSISVENLVRKVKESDKDEMADIDQEIKNEEADNYIGSNNAPKNMQELTQYVRNIDRGLTFRKQTNN